MNKFTQTFRQQHLETLYQKNKEIDCYSAYKKIAILSFIIALIRLINFAQEEIMVGILITSSILLIIVLMSILIMKFCPSGAVYCLLFINNLLILFQVNDQAGTNQFILGTNLAIVHVTILLIIDYKIALLNIILQTIFKLVIAGIFDQKTDVCSIVFSVICPLCFLTIAYQVEKLRRLLFLSNNQGNDWHCLLPSVISDPFILFTFDENRMCFKYKNSSKIDRFPYCSHDFTPEDNFRQFFRMSSIGKISMEQFIINRIEKQTKFFDLNQFTLKPMLYDTTDFEETQILLAELYHLEDNFLIVLEQSKQRANNLQATKDNLINLISQHQQLVYNFLRKQGQLITSCLCNESARVQNLYQLKIHHLYFQGKYKVSNSFSKANYISETASFNFKQVLSQIIMIFKKAYPEWCFCFDFTDNKYDVVHYKDMTQDFMIQLLQVTLRKVSQDSRNQTRILMHSTQDMIMIRIICINSYLLVDNLNKNFVIKLYLKFHSPEIKIKATDNGIFIQLYKDITQLKSLNKFEDCN